MAETHKAVWHTLKNVKARISWNSDPGFNFLEIRTNGWQFNIPLTIETSEFLIKKFGDPVLHKIIEDCRKKPKSRKKS